MKTLQPVCLRFVPIALVLLVSSIHIVAASAQSVTTKSNPSVDGQRPPSTQIGLFEVLKSASDAFLELFAANSDESPAEQPQWNSLKSPRHSVMTFLKAMEQVALGRREFLDRATQTFGKTDVDDARQTAMDLLSVFDRLPKLSSGVIPGPEVVREKQLRRYELFPRGIESEWVYRALDGSPNGSIVLVAAEDGSWTFDEATIRGVADLLDSMKKIPPRRRLTKQGDLFLSVIEPTARKSSAADWLFFVACLIGGIAVAWGVGKILSQVKSWSERRGDGLLLPLLNGIIVPSYILLITVGAAIGSARLHFHPTLAGVRNGFIEAAVILAGVFLLVALIELGCLGVRRSFFCNDDPYARMVSIMVRRAIRIVAGIVVTIFLMQNVLRWNVTALLGGFAIIALALSLASQDAVKNLFGAFTVFATRPFLSGDWVRFDGRIGEITDVSLQATKIRLLNGELYSVPNMKFIDTAVENLSERRYLRRVLQIAVTYDTPPEKVRKAIDILKEILTSEEVAGDGQGDTETYPPRIWFEEFGDHYLGLRADYWYLMRTDDGDIQRDTERGWFSYLDHASMVNQIVLERFKDAEIHFAFPTQSIYLTDDPVRGLNVTRQQQPVSS